MAVNEPEKTPFEYLIALGSSIEPRAKYLEDCLLLISERIGSVTREATPIVTPPMGPNAKREFTNSAIIVTSSEDPELVIDRLLAIETDLGRKRDLHWGDRTIDCDIILARKSGMSLQVSSSKLTIPHPSCHQRDFVLRPCAEIAADWMHPLLSETISSLLTRLRAQSEV